MAEETQQPQSQENQAPDQAPDQAPAQGQTGPELDHKFYAWLANELNTGINETTNKPYNKSILPLSGGNVDLDALSVMIPGYAQYEMQRKQAELRHETIMNNLKTTTQLQNLQSDLLTNIESKGGLNVAENRAALGEAFQAGSAKYDNDSGTWHITGSQMKQPDNQIFNMPHNITVKNHPDEQTDGKNYLQIYQETALKQLGTVSESNPMFDADGNEIVGVDTSKLTSDERNENVVNDNQMVEVKYKDGTTHEVRLYDITDHKKVMDSINSNPKATNSLKGNLSKEQTDALNHANTALSFLERGQLTMDEIAHWAGIGDNAANKLYKYISDNPGTRVEMLNRIIASDVFRNVIKTGTASKDQRIDWDSFARNANFANKEAFEMTTMLLDIIGNGSRLSNKNDAYTYQLDNQLRRTQEATLALQFQKSLYDIYNDVGGWFGKSKKEFANTLKGLDPKRDGKYMKLTHGTDVYRMDPNGRWQKLEIDNTGKKRYKTISVTELNSVFK